MSANLPTQDIKRRKPQQARSLERVNRILDVAEELFIADGYNATTTNAIAVLAKVPILGRFISFSRQGGDRASLS